LVVGALSCTRDPNEWPPSEVEGLEASCPAVLGDSRFCPCFAKEVAKRVPLPRGVAFVNAKKKGAEFADVWMAAKAAAETCTQGHDVSKWPPALIKTFITSCLAERGTTRRSCECLADYAGQSISYIEYVGWGAELKAGHPTSEKMTALFSGRAAAQCLLADGVWPERAVREFVTQCQSEFDGTAAECRCFVDQMKESVSVEDLYVVGAGADGGTEISDRIAARSPGWWSHCTAPAAKPKRPTAKKR
jgi:hypothetical protein